MHRKLLLTHLLLAAFFLPVAVLFAITGGLYTWEIKGSYRDTSVEIPLETPLKPELRALIAVAAAELDARGIEAPSGRASVKRAGTSFELEWTGANRDVLLRPTAEPDRAELLVRDTTPYRHLVQIHKAKGSVYARIISATWAVGLLAILGSGLMMALRAPRWRPLALRAGAAGVLSFVLYVLLG